MGITKKITCDNCGAEKLQSNHWFMALTLYNTKSITIDHFDLKLAEEHSFDILCGEACVLQYVSKNLPRIVPTAAPSRSEHPANSDNNTNVITQAALNKGVKLAEHPAEAVIDMGFFGEAEDDLEHRRR